MTDNELDPAIQELFKSAEQELAGDVFVTEVMHRSVNRTSKAHLPGNGFRFFAVLFAFVFFVMMVWEPFYRVLSGFSAGLSRPLLEMSSEGFMAVVAPANTVGSLLALSILGSHLVYRRIFC